VTAATRKAGALAQRRIKLSPLRQAAAQHRAAGRLGTADAIGALTARLEATEPELWLLFDLPQIERALPA
jgi:hypothetical protein